MRRLGLAALLFGASFAPGFCTSYDDLNLGIQARNNGDWADAIIYFDRALAANDLAPGLQYVAHLDRAEAYASQHDLDAAIADYATSLTLRPGDAVALSDRASIYFMAGRFDDSAHDLDDVIAAHPGYSGMYFRRAVVNVRRGELDKSAADIKTARTLLRNIPDGALREIGIVEWQVGRTEDAEADFSNALSRVSGDPYAWLWLTLSDVRLGKPVSKRSLPDFDRSAWPGPILDFFVGNTTRDAVFATAAQAGGDTLTGQLCEANFYIGEWLVQQRDITNARPLIAKAASDCPINFVEWSPAQSEMKNLSDAKAP